jgi:hypothetical protein
METQITRSRIQAVRFLIERIVAIALICSYSCSWRQPPQTEPPLAGNIQVRLWQYFWKGINQFGDGRLGIIANLGQPKQAITGEELGSTKKLSQEEKRYIWGHGAEIKNEIIELAYDGLTIRILKVNSPPYREFIYDMTVTSSRYKMPGNLNVGSKRKDVLRFLGNPSKSGDRRDAYEVVYVDSNGEQGAGYINQITFSYRGDSVSRISFWLYLD